MPSKLWKILVVFVAVQMSCQDQQVQQPNIILVISDDQAWSDYGFMGHPQIETPFLDRLSANSLTFTHGYATAPLCSPSLASIMSGRYAHRHLVSGNDPTFTHAGRRYGEEWLLARQPHYEPFKENYYQQKILTDHLNEAGYRCFQSGKWWLGSWSDAHFDGGMTHGDPKKGGRHGDEGLKIGRDGLLPIQQFIADAQSANEPFFIWYAPFLPHTPHNPPSELLEKYLAKTDSEHLAKYWAMCDWFDQTIGALVSHLDNENLTENTVILYTTDNGWIQKPHENGYAPRSKRTPYEKGIRTPFMIHWPNHIQPKIDRTTMVSNIDIFPTLLHVANVTREDDFAGINLLDEQARADRTTIFAENFAHDMPNIDSLALGLQHRVAIQWPWKLILPDTNNIPGAMLELFNLSDDPLENKNIAHENPAVVQTLSHEINAWYTPAQP